MNYKLVDEIMEQAQVFASEWSMVGGPFDSGNCLQLAENEKQTLRAMLEASPPVEVKPVGILHRKRLEVYQPKLTIYESSDITFLNEVEDDYDSLPRYLSLPDGDYKLYTSPPDTEAKLTTLLTAVENYIAPANSFIEIEDRLQELKRLHAEYTK